MLLFIHQLDENNRTEGVNTKRNQDINVATAPSAHLKLSPDNDALLWIEHRYGC